jgi:hypothetical protein
MQLPTHQLFDQSRQFLPRIAYLPASWAKAREDRFPHHPVENEGSDPAHQNESLF